MNNYAISTDGVATALQNSAAALVTAGNDMDEAVALVTAGNVITQDPSKVGAGMRTIALRLTGTKSAVEQLRDMGEETDDVVTSQSKLRDIIMEATKVASNEFKGFDIFDDNGNYKSTYDIMLGLSEIYKEIAETDKKMGTNNLNLLLETIAGKTRANIAASILQNGEILENAYKSSQQADGSAMKENEKYLDSIEGKMQQFTNSAHEALNVAIDSDWIKTLIDGATSLLNVLTEILKIINEIPGGLMGFAPIVGAGGLFGTYINGGGSIKSSKKLVGNGLSKNVFNSSMLKNAVSILHGTTLDFSELGDENMANAIRNLIDLEKIDISSVTEDELAEKLGTLPAVLDDVGEGAAKGATKFEKFSDALDDVFASLSVSALIGTAVWLLSQLAKWADNAHDSFDELNDRVSNIKDTFQNSQKQISNNASTIDEIKDRYSALSEGVDSFGNNISLSEESFKEYQSICNEIAGMYPTLISGYDAQGNAIVNLKGNVDALTDSLKEQTKAAYESAFVGTDGNNGAQDIIDRYKKSQKTDNIDKIWDTLKFWDGSQEGGLLSTQEIIDYESRILDEFSGKQFSELNPTGIRNYIDKLDELGALTGYINNNVVNLNDINNWSESDWNNLLSRLAEDRTKHQLDVEQNISDLRWAAEVSIHLAPDYDSLDSDMQNVASMIANNLSDEVVTGWENSNDIKDYSNKLVEKLRSISPDLQERFGEMFKDGAFDTPIDESIKKFDEFKEEISDDFSSDEINAIEKVLGVDKIRETQSKLSKFMNGITGDTKQLTSELSKLNRDGVEKFLSRAASIKDVSELMKILSDVVADIDYSEAQEELNTFFKEASNAVAQVDKMNAALVSGLQSGGMSISYEVGENGEESWTGTIEDVRKAFGELESFNINGLLKRTSNGVKVNQKAWRKLRQEQENLQKKKFLEKQADLTAQLTDLQTQLIAAQAKGEDTGNLQKRISDLQENIDNVNFLAAAYDGATSAYQKWLDVQAGPKEGDIYDNIRDNALTRGDELLKNGMVGDEFRSIAQMFSSEDLSTAPLEQVIEAYQAIDKIVPGTTKKVRDFFTEDMQGAFAFSDALVELGYATGSSTEGYEFGLFTTEEIAKSLGVSQDIVDAIFDKMRLFGADVTLLSDDEVEKLKTAGKNVDELQDKLENLNKEQKVTKDSSELDISVATNFNLDELNTVDELQGKIDELNTLRANPNISDESAKILDSILAEVIKKLDIINGTDANPDVITIDDVIQAQEQLDTLKKRLAQIKEYNDTHINVQVNAEEDQTVQDIAEYLAGLDEGLQLDLGINPENVGNAEAIIEQLLSGDLKIEDVTGVKEGVEKELKAADTSVDVEAHVNTDGMNDPNTLIQEKFATKGITTTNTVNTKTTGQEGVDSLSDSINNVNDKKVNVEAKVKGTGTVIALDRSIDDLTGKKVEVTAEVHGTGTVMALASAINDLRDKDITVTTHHRNDVNGTANRSTQANGTAHAGGTTYAHGKWGAPRTETALVNELGPEIIVRDGRWFTANDGQPGFTGIKKGDIIFNHKQSEELLKNGYVTKGYAHMAFAEGTAYANVGSWGAYFTQQQYNKQGINTASTVQASAVNAANAVKDAAKKVKDDVDKTVDWIEILLDRIDRRIQTLADAADDTWRTFSSRRNNLYKEIDAVRQQEVYAQQGAERYKKQANKVGLPANLRKLVQQGKIDISSVKTEDLKKKVEEYQGWWDKYLDCLALVKESQYTQNELFNQNYDMVKTEYEGLLGSIEHSITTLQNFIDIAEEDGHFSSSKYYTEMIKYEKKNISTLKKEKKQLTTALNDALANGLKVGSEEWVNMTNGIKECDEAIQESTKNIISYNNAIRDLKWERWDFLIDRIEDVNTELKFLYDLIDEDKMFDDKGLVTIAGMNGLSLLAEQMDVYMKESQKYAEMIKTTEEDLVKDPYDTDLIEKLSELRKAQQDSIISANDQKKAIRDLVKNGYDKMSESLRKIIDDYTELLDSNKDMYDYQQNVIDQQKEISRLQRQVQAWGGDNSEEGAARRQQTSAELADAQKKLAETMEDRRISETKEMLNDLYDNYTEILNNRLDDIEATVEQVVDAVNTVAAGTNAIADANVSILDLSGLVAEAKDELLGGNENIILKTIKDSAEYVGYNITSETQKALGDNTAIKDGVREIVSAFQMGDFTVKDAAVIKSLNDISDFIFKEMVPALNAIAEAEIKTTTTTTTTTTTKKKKKTPTTSKKKAKKPTTPKKKTSSKVVIKTSIGSTAPKGKTQSIITSTKQNVEAIFKYARGGKNLKEQLAWLDEYGRNETIIRKSDGAVLTRLNLGDSVLKKMASDNLWNMANDPTQFIKDNMPSNTKVSNIGGGTQNNSFDISINVPNVTNYREFMSAMQKDKQFERLIQEMTLGQMNGNNSLRKHSINIR